LRINDENLWIKTATGWEPLFDKSMLLFVRELAELRTMSVAGYVWGVVDAELTECRRKRIDKNFLLPNGRLDPPPLREKKQRKERELAPVIKQKILFLAETEKLNARELAQRFGVSAQTVGRILQRREENTIRVPTAPRPKHGQRWGDTGGGASA
jgi:hypothetical protein